MSRESHIEKAKEIIQERIDMAKDTTDNENYLMQLTIKDGKHRVDLLESEPPQGEFTKKFRASCEVAIDKAIIAICKHFCPEEIDQLDLYFVVQSAVGEKIAKEIEQALKGGD